MRGKEEATFDIKGSNNVFIMTGGEIQIQDRLPNVTGGGLLLLTELYGLNLVKVIIVFLVVL